MLTWPLCLQTASRNSGGRLRNGRNRAASLEPPAPSSYLNITAITASGEGEENERERERERRDFGRGEAGKPERDGTRSILFTEPPSSC